LALKPKEIWAIRIRLQVDEWIRDLALFYLGIDSKLERKANPSDPRRFIRKSCHSRPNMGPMAQRKKMACQLSLASH